MKTNIKVTAQQAILVLKRIPKNTKLVISAKDLQRIIDENMVKIGIKELK